MHTEEPELPDEAEGLSNFLACCIDDYLFKRSEYLEKVNSKSNRDRNDFYHFDSLLIDNMENGDFRK